MTTDAVEWNYKCAGFIVPRQVHRSCAFLAKLLWQAFQRATLGVCFLLDAGTRHPLFEWGGLMTLLRCRVLVFWEQGWPCCSVIRFNRLFFLPGTTIRMKLLAKLGNVDKTFDKPLRFTKGDEHVRKASERFVEYELCTWNERYDRGNVGKSSGSLRNPYGYVNTPRRKWLVRDSV